MTAEEKRVVVTGLGTVSSLGSGDDFWSNLIEGVSGVDQITAFDASRFPTTIGAECKGFEAKALGASELCQSPSRPTRGQMPQV